MKTRSELVHFCWTENDTKMPPIVADPLNRQAEECFYLTSEGQSAGRMNHSYWEGRQLPRSQGTRQHFQELKPLLLLIVQKKIRKCKGIPQATKHNLSCPPGKSDAEKWTFSKVVVQAWWGITEKTAFHRKYLASKSQMSSLGNWKHRHNQLVSTALKHWGMVERAMLRNKRLAF